MENNHGRMIVNQAFHCHGRMMVNHGRMMVSFMENPMIIADLKLPPFQETSMCKDHRDTEWEYDGYVKLLDFIGIL